MRHVPRFIPSFSSNLPHDAPRNTPLHLLGRSPWFDHTTFRRGLGGLSHHTSERTCDGAGGC